MIVPLIDISALVDTIHVTINQKDQVLVVYFHHRCTMVHISSYAGLSTSTLPAAHLMHACLSLLPEASTHFPRILTILSWPILSSPLKSLSIFWNGFASMGKTHLPIINYPHHKCHKVLMTQDVNIYSQCLF